MIIIHFHNDDVRNKPQPWPIGLQPEPVPGYPDVARWVATSGLGPDDGAVLVGFGPIGAQRITVMPDAAFTDPSLVVGLAPTFSDGQFFEWAVPISELEVRS